MKKSLVFGTGFFIVPRSVLGGKGYTPPSDMLNIGAIGIEEKVGTLWAIGQKTKGLFLFVM